MCVYLSLIAKDKQRPGEIFDMTAAIQHPQLLNNKDTAAKKNMG